MENASNQIVHIEIPTEKPPGTTPPSYVLNSILKVSPRHNGSNLYDSFELQAVTKQLNRAIQGSNSSLSPYSCSFTSPFYRQRLDRIYRENAKTPKRIPCSRLDGAVLNMKVSTNGTRRFILRLWKKVKHGFKRSK